MELESHSEIELAAERLLRLADARGRLPTPVDDIVAAAALTQPVESLLGAGVLGEAPGYLRRAMQRIGGRILGLIDRRAREVHLDPTISVEGRRRFITLHETGHDALPWQRALAYADSDHTLSPEVRQLYEIEASSFAAEVLFQRGSLTQDAADLQLGLAAVVDLQTRYGASLRATLRRYAEGHSDCVAALALANEPESHHPLTFRRHELVRSPAFEARFGSGPWPGRLVATRFDFLHFAASAAAAPHQAVGGTTLLTDVNGDRVSLRCEALCTSYNVLVLLWLARSQRARRKLRIVG